MKSLEVRTGVEPGYFYEEGAKDIGQWVGGSPKEQARFSGQLAATSPQAPVSTNMMGAVRGNEQQALGYPVLTGKSPGQVRKDFAKIEESIAKQTAAGEAPTVQVGGPKTKPFGQLLNKEPALGPNDRWEMISMGYDRNASFSPQERQMAHYVRQRAVEKLQQKGINLDIAQAQELNWQAVRAPETRTEMIPGEGDTFQHSIKPHRVQHNWEIAPGSEANHFPEWGNLKPEVQSEIANRLNAAIIDPKTGRDQLVEATGGRIQPGKFTKTQGVFEGQQSEGFKSYSAAPVEPSRGKGGLEKATQERLTATESGRSLALGQAAGSAYVTRPGQASTGANEVVFGLNQPLSAEETGKLQEALNDVFGKDKVFPEFRPEGVALVEWESPLRLRAAEGEFNAYGRDVKFKKPSDTFPGGAVELQPKSKAALKRLQKEYGEAVKVNAKTGKVTISGQPTEWQRALATGGGYNRIMEVLGQKYNRGGADYGLRDGIYAPLNWKEGQATTDFLATLKAPAQRQAFDSPQVRGIMGRIADAFDGIVKDGLATPNPKLHRLVRAWSEKGIEEVERLAKAGLAPAAAIGTAVALYNQQGAKQAPSQPREI